MVKDIYMRRLKTQVGLIVALPILMASTLSFAAAPIAGATTVGTTSVQELAVGWSAKKDILGKTVYNEKKEKVGKVDDLIVTPENAVSYAIVGAGGFVGVGKHDVAIPLAQLRDEQGNITLPGATKDSIKNLPEFKYAKKK